MTIHGELVIHTEKCSEKALEKAQKYLDQEVIRTCAPYVPLDTGTLEGSGKLSSDIGSGTVTWNTPYAQKQYYEGKSREDICSALREKFGEKNLEMQVLNRS